MQHLKETEQAEIRRLVTEAIKLGHMVEVAYDDDTEPAMPATDDADLIYDEIGATESTTLRLYDRSSTSYRGWIYLVHGNGRGETVADYSCTPHVEALIDLTEAV